MGIAPTRDAARQIVSHRHISVNGKVVNIPSYTVKPGDTIGVRERSKSLEAITGSLMGKGVRVSWLDFDKATMSGKIISLPTRDQIQENIKEQLIVELYSK
jgi:small subunit ribosomal protein S4